MFNAKLIDFFKKHNLYDQEMFTYMARNCQFVDYSDPDVNFTVACGPRVNPNTNVIEGFQMVIPYYRGEKTAFISIHEMAHAIYWYKKIGQIYKPLEEELFAFIVERVYFEENKTPSLEEYVTYLDSTIDEEVRESYRFAYANRDNFIGWDISDFDNIDKTTKELALIWEKENR